MTVRPELILQDLKVALRSLWRSRGLSITVIVTLALGIGANAAIFSLVRGVLLRPLANRGEDRLIYIRQAAPGYGQEDVPFSVPEVQDLKGSVKSVGSFGEFSMNGARGRSNNYLLDGTDMNDGYRNDPAINQAGVFGTPSTILPIDAVAEVNVISNFQPEYGRNAGAVVNIVTKSGSNALHGSAAEYFRNSALDARNYFNASPAPKTLINLLNR